MLPFCIKHTKEVKSNILTKSILGLGSINNHLNNFTYDNKPDDNDNLPDCKFGNNVYFKNLTYQFKTNSLPLFHLNICFSCTKLYRLLDSPSLIKMQTLVLLYLLLSRELKIIQVFQQMLLLLLYRTEKHLLKHRQLKLSYT